MSELEEQLARQAAANEARAKDSKKMWFAIAIVFGVIFAVGGIAGLVDGSLELGCSPDVEKECINRGSRYYREIGSYPTLSDGRQADDVVRERCGRSSSAF